MSTTTAPVQTLSATAGAARRAIGACWMLGGILLPCGAGIAGAAATMTDGLGALFAGLALAGVGQLVVLVAVIATGVRLGVESAKR